MASAAQPPFSPSPPAAVSGDGRDTSGLTSSLLLTYVERELGPRGVADLLEKAGPGLDEARLRDRDVWIDWGTKIRLFEAACQVLGDPRALRGVGAAAIDLNVAPGIKLAARAFGSPRATYANSVRVAAKLSCSHRFTADELSSRHAVLRYEDVSGVGYHRCDCDYNIGFIESGPELYNLPRARVVHTHCALEGAAECIYEVSWRPRSPTRSTFAATGASVVAATGLLGAAGFDALPVAAAIAAAVNVPAWRRLALHRRRRWDHLKAEVDEQREEVERFARSLRELSSELGLDDVLDHIARDAKIAVGGRDFVLLLSDGGAEPGGLGPLRCERSSGLPADVQATLAEWAAETVDAARAAPVALDSFDDATPGLRALVHHPDGAFASLCAAPLLFRGELLGVLVALARGPGAFAAQDAELLGTYAQQAAVALSNAHLVARLESLATRDVVTGLANEAGLQADLAREVRRGPVRAVTLALLRVTGADGAAVARAAGGVLAGLAGQRDTVARLHGQEYALLLPETVGEDAEERILAAVRATAERLSGDGVRVHAGSASWPAQAGRAEDLLELARGALEWAERDRAEHRGYDPHHVETRTGSEHRSRIVAVLEDPATLRPVFQPIVRLEPDGALRITGYEALTRFAGPNRPPDVWFAEAARCGLGAPLEALAIRRALETPGRPVGVSLSVNVSPATLASDALAAVLPESLTGLVIEITEHAAFDTDDSLDASLALLRARGARIALDDAGSGYAGLQQLVRIRPDLVKLDRSLVCDVDEDPARASLIESLVRFAAATGAEVCAEGVERTGELDRLRELGVHYAQGYLLARPGPDWPALESAALAQAPVEPKPPAPLELPSSIVVSTTSGAATGATTSWAMRSPAASDTGSAGSVLSSSTPTSPR